MVVSEKGLIRAMKEAYKGYGYKIANDNSAGVQELVISYPGWAVVMTMKNVPRKVLGLVAEHLGKIPEPGEAFQVSKKQAQTEIFDVSMGVIHNMVGGEKQRRKAMPTDLELGGYRLWQREQDYAVVRVDPEKEAIMLSHGRTVWMFDDETLMVDGNASRVYIETCYLPETEKLLEHLGKVKWVSFEK